VLRKSPFWRMYACLPEPRAQAGGIDNVGKMTPDGSLYFYLKDHLGTIRAVVNESNTVVSAKDYDMWGYPLENRTYASLSSNRYQFIGKERDNESNYDYFVCGSMRCAVLCLPSEAQRRRDSRIGRWGSMEPLLEKFVSFSPYSYSILNSLRYNDQFGLGPRITCYGNDFEVTFNLNYVTKENDAINGLDQHQITVLNQLARSIQDWGGVFRIFGRDRYVDVYVNLIPHSSILSEMPKDVNGVSGNDFVIDASDYPGIVEQISARGLGYTNGYLYVSWKCFKTF
jgi:hypothetical protein